jgi:hypothetical protein
MELDSLKNKVVNITSQEVGITSFQQVLFITPFTKPLNPNVEDYKN